MANPDGRPPKEVWVGGPYKNLHTHWQSTSLSLQHVADKQLPAKVLVPPAPKPLSDVTVVRNQGLFDVITHNRPSVQCAVRGDRRSETQSRLPVCSSVSKFGTADECQRSSGSVCPVGRWEGRKGSNDSDRIAGCGCPKVQYHELLSRVS